MNFKKIGLFISQSFLGKMKQKTHRIQRVELGESVLLNFSF